MREFVDEQGRTWGLRVDVTSIRRVRELVGIDLTKCLDSKEALQGLVDDVIRLVDTLHALCKTQCEHRSIDAESFANALYGDAISRATNALMESIIDFFPQGRGKILRQIWNKAQEMAKANQEQLEIAVIELMSSDSSGPMPVMQELAQKVGRFENLPSSLKQRGKKTQGSKRRFGTD